MKKENSFKYVSFSIVGFLVLFVLVFEVDRMLETKQEFEDNKVFVQKHNEKIKEWEKTGKKFVVKKGYSKFKRELREREILPYDKPLPPVPEIGEVAKNFVDVNQNNVRDDVEASVVRRYESDRDVVEAIFADIKVKQYELYLAKNDLLTDKYIEQSLDFYDIARACNDYYYETSEFYDSTYNDGMYYNYRKISKLFYNTRKRNKIHNKYNRKLGGRALESEKVDDKICKEFFKESKRWVVN
ncbi:hypothetical protein CSB11_02890 [Candidatus Campbellbacteria bacterium]|nr:MAG: hypothetical protein CSB11_02890 [Candidatus Campbellbacteria bacterium]